MDQSNQAIERELKNLLYEMLSTRYQQDAIISLDYDPKSQECTVKLTVHIVEEDQYIGFAGY